MIVFFSEKEINKLLIKLNRFALVPVKEIIKVPVHIPAPYPVEKTVHYPVHVPVDRPVPVKVSLFVLYAQN